MESHFFELPELGSFFIAKLNCPLRPFVFAVFFPLPSAREHSAEVWQSFKGTPIEQARFAKLIGKVPFVPSPLLGAPQKQRSLEVRPDLVNISGVPTPQDKMHMAIFGWNTLTEAGI